jgi:hypothetical protein
MSKIGVEDLFGYGRSCAVRFVKDGRKWLAFHRQRQVGTFKRKPTKWQRARLRKEICGPWGD